MTDILSTINESAIIPTYLDLRINNRISTPIDFQIQITKAPDFPIYFWPLFTFQSNFPFIIFELWFNLLKWALQLYFVLSTHHKHNGEKDATTNNHRKSICEPGAPVHLVRYTLTRTECVFLYYGLEISPKCMPQV